MSSLSAGQIREAGKTEEWHFGFITILMSHIVVIQGDGV